MSDTNIAAAAALFAGAGLLWTIIWSVISANKLNQIQQQVTLSNRLHDQSVQRLYRAREAVITVHKTFMRTLYYLAVDMNTDEGFRTAHVEWSASIAELKGITDAINNEELTGLVTTFIHYVPDAKNPSKSEQFIMSFSARLHTVITNLLVESTKV